MKPVRYMSAAIPSVISVLVATSAFAQSKDERDVEDTNVLTEKMPSISNALELGVQAGYSQGFGDVAKGQSTVSDLSGPGGAVEVDVGYRISPQFLIGIYGGSTMASRGDALADGTDVRGATAGVQAQYHFRPTYTIDPWVGLAAGWRGTWLVPDQGKNTSLQGLQLARLQVGADYRVSPEIAIAPVVGADLSMYLSENGPGLSGYTNIVDPRVNTTIFAGLAARFDITGKTGSTAASATSTTATF
jgi:hypothetical protein